MADLKQFNSAIQSTKTQDYLSVVLGSKKESFVTSLVSLVGSDEKLQACEPLTLIYAAAKSTALGLPIEANLGFAYVIPFRDTKANKTIATYQIGAKGFRQLAARSGKYEIINEVEVREGEIKGRDRMTGEIQFQWIEDEEERNKRRIIGYVGYFKLINGYRKTIYKTVAELEAHGKRYSMTYKKGYGLWKDNFDAMCRKTIVKMLLSKGDAPLSIEMQEAIKYDQSMIGADGNPTYIDSQPKASDEEQAKDFIEDVVPVEETVDQTPAKPDIVDQTPAKPDIVDQTPAKEDNMNQEPQGKKTVCNPKGNALFEE